MPAVSASTPAPVRAEPKKTGMHDARLPRQRSERVVRDARLVLEVRGEQRVVVLGQRGRRARGEAGRVPRREGGVRRPEPVRRAERHDGGVSFSEIARSTRSSSGAGPVDLVDEDERRDAQPSQRAHEHAGLRLHSLDGGDDEHRAVQHAEHALDLGDEVRVARRVDQVDGDVVDRERHDRGLDRDAALPLQRE